VARRKAPSVHVVLLRSAPSSSGASGGARLGSGPAQPSGGELVAAGGHQCSGSFGQERSRSFDYLIEGLSGRAVAAEV